MAMVCTTGLALAATPSRTVGVGTPAEILEACAKADPGDEIVIGEGNYRDVFIRFGRSGTRDRPIVLRAASGGRVVFGGSSRIHLGGDHIIVKDISFAKNELVGLGAVVRFYGDHNRVTGCSIADPRLHRKHEDDYASGAVIQVYRGAQRNELDHNCLYWNDNLCYFIHIQVSPDEPNYTWIHHNYIGYQRRVYEGRGFGKDGYVTLQPGMSNEVLFPSRTLVEYNLFDHCEGIVSMIDNKSAQNVYRYNTFRDIEGGITLRGGKNCVVEGNFFFLDGNVRSWGIRVFDGGHRIVNNYIHGSHTNVAVIDIHIGQVENTAPNNVVVAHNTIINCRAAGIALHYLPQSGIDPERMSYPDKRTLIIANNLSYSTRIDAINDPANPFSVMSLQDQTRYMTWIGNIACESGSGVRRYPAGVTTGIDPELAPSPDGIWRPAAESPAVGAARDYPDTAVDGIPDVAGTGAGLETDIDGQPRGVRRDVGCDQVTSAPVRRRPLTKADVGPAWMAGVVPYP